MKDELGRFDVLAHFNDAQLRQLAGCAEERTVPAGGVIFNENEASSEIYLLRRGSVRVRRPTPYGDFDLGRLDGPELFGEQSFIDDLMRTSSVEAHTTAELLVLDPPSLAAVSGIDPAFQQALYWSFWKSLSAKLRGANARLLDFFEPDASAADTPAADSLQLSSEPANLDLKAKMSVFEEQRLSGMEINFLSTLSHEQRFTPGQRIFHQGDPGDRMYVVVDGQVMISTVVAGAGEEALSFLERGDFFGEMALIDGKPRSADARAHPQLGALVLGIPKEVIDGLLDATRVSSISLLRLLCRMISKRLRAIDEKLVGWFLVAAADPKARPELISQT